jgi:DNA-binding NtrC family response regulator
MARARVLIVEDQPAVTEALEVLLDVHGIPFSVAKSPAEAVALVESGAIGVVIQDMNFRAGATSGREGIELFRRIRAIDSAMPILLMTAWTSLETAVELVREGAHDYMAKPWNDEKLVRTVQSLLGARTVSHDGGAGGPIPPRAERAINHDAGAPILQRATDPGEAASGPVPQRGERASASPGDVAADYCGAVFQSERMAKLFAFAVHVAKSDVPVLITGPNGAGKEKFAEVIAANSARKRGPFVKVNVGALPDDLLEAELFGAEPGAFTGANKLRIGRFEAAHGGTLFLDEIGVLSLSGQRKLLRVLERQEFERLGSSETRRVDVRVLLATNVDLRSEVSAGRFREDLFFRMNVIEIAVPPLCARPEDIVPLARAFIAQHGGGALSEKAVEVLLAHPWPGNVRELQNRVRRAQVVKSGPTIEPSDLDLPTTPAVSAAEPASERSELEALLRRHQGHVTRVAEELQMSRQALYRKMDRLGVVLERKPRDD